MEEWQIFCTSVTILIMMAIFICYTILPELKNLNGSIFRSYLATYIIGDMILLKGLTDYFKNCSFCVDATLYTVMSVVLWLNVMSFNIWKTFRVMQSTNIHVDESEKKKFICYAIYAWGIPIVLGTIDVGLSLGRKNIGLYYFDLGMTMLLVCIIGIIGAVCISNIFMFTWTALRIKRLKNETSHLADGVNRHSKIHKQWLNLYLKLFIIMGAHIIVWPLSFVCSRPNFVCLHLDEMDIIIPSEMISAILTFVICIWKEDVKQSFCKQLTKILHRLQKAFRPSHGRGGNPETRLNADPRESKFNAELNSEPISNIYTITTENVSA